MLWPAVTENRTYVYERLCCDPQCSQHIILHQDEYGQPLCQVSVNYPRRARPPRSPYPALLPETLFAGSYDEQQQTLRLTQQQSSWYTLLDSAAGIRVTGLADASRRDVFTHPATAVPPGGLTQDVLNERQLLVADGATRTFAGQQQTFWQGKTLADTVTPPAFPPLRAYTETAVLDEDCVSGMSFAPEKNRSTVPENAGYRKVPYLFARDGEDTATLWVTRSGSTEYGNAGQFWRPQAYTTRPLTGKNTLTWDAHFCVVTAHRDAAGLTVSVQHDWRFMTPVQLTDGNDSVHTVTLDTLGRVTILRFHGTENGQPCGYSDHSLTVPASAEEMLTLSAPLPVHKCRVYITDSWMKTGPEKQPPHVVTLTTDRYDDDPAQQIRQQVTFTDGFGRHLQTSVNHGGGRRAVTGRTEYDNKGQPVRTYQPFFSDTWRYMNDSGTPEVRYADTHYYDPTGREY